MYLPTSQCVVILPPISCSYLGATRSVPTARNESEGLPGILATAPLWLQTCEQWNSLGSSVELINCLFT